ncbi:hypothetical protein [Flavobacterium cerinum]|uniref:Lipoprotein n=1 Tax=Flavobacterium cerinum TaxID=2502784 RepID=A0ABY5IR00_9FLAO|nr:hypothetical protein [Flavobacterium cerinum]UUC45189.1 hypothetical protein NOX80_16380 [Flavobacterium cerinum]
MKTKKITLLISLLIVIISGYVWATKCHRKLPEVSSYSILSDTGQPIPAKLYSRIKEAKIDGKEQIIKEYILCFNDSLLSEPVSEKERLYKYLVIVPVVEMIGLPDYMQSFKEKGKYLYQSDEEADIFTPIVNNYNFFEDPPIKKAIYTDKKISFNTFGVLKQFGNTVIVEIKK